jgi:cytochrome c oxidase assembly protein subunit 15
MWTEYLNRLLGVTVGFLILATVVSAWRHHRKEPRILWTCVAALLLTGFQGWLGGRVVVHELAAWIVTVHMIVALVIVQLLLYATVRAWPHREKTTIPLLFPAALTIATMIQIGIGTQVREAVQTAMDSGISRSGALTSIGELDHLHRYAAVLIFGGAIALVVWLWKKKAAGNTTMRWACAVAALAALQVGLGIVMAYVSLFPAAQVLHLTVASLLLGAQTVVLLRQSDF